MREKEIKILWGRSGNRCAICKIELTPSGDKETLGEMAHIVARSDDGPRGGLPLTIQERDKYSNLILLCPTHHTEIDKNHNDWSIDKLHRIKTEHEAWVSEQLGTGNISVTAIDNSDFLNGRIAEWQELSRNHISIVLSLTPLQISGDQIDTMDERSQQHLEQATLPGKNPVQNVNRHHTRPSEFGLVNEHFPDLPQRFGHSYHIFKTGHCEYLQELGYNADRLTDHIRERGDDIDDIKGAQYAIRYTDIAEAIESGLAWLELLWNEIIPFEYLDFQCVVLNTNNTIMYSYEDDWSGGVFGHPTRSEYLLYKEILPKEHDSESLELNILQWVSNCYGLVLDSKLDNQGNVKRPVRMR